VVSDTLVQNVCGFDVDKCIVMRLLVGGWKNEAQQRAQGIDKWNGIEQTRKKVDGG